VGAALPDLDNTPTDRRVQAVDVHRRQPAHTADTQQTHSKPCCADCRRAPLRAHPHKALPESCLGRRATGRFCERPLSLCSPVDGDGCVRPVVSCVVAGTHQAAKVKVATLDPVRGQATAAAGRAKRNWTW
jgi:hypothetical protein